MEKRPPTQKHVDVQRALDVSLPQILELLTFDVIPFSVSDIAAIIGDNYASTATFLETLRKRGLVESTKLRLRYPTRLYHNIGCRERDLRRLRLATLWALALEDERAAGHGMNGRDIVGMPKDMSLEYINEMETALALHTRLEEHFSAPTSAASAEAPHDAPPFSGMPTGRLMLKELLAALSPSVLTANRASLNTQRRVA